MFRKLHRVVGIVFAPFFLMTPITGIMLLFRKDAIYGKETKNLLIAIHNWEGVAKYVGILLAVALVFTVATGLYLFVQYYRSKKRREVIKRIQA